MAQKQTNSIEYPDYSYCSQGLGSKYFRKGNSQELNYEPYRNGSRIMTPVDRASATSSEPKNDSNDEV